MTSHPDSSAESHPQAGHGVPAHWRLRLVAVTFPAALVLGVLGYQDYGHGAEHSSFSNALYHTVQLFLLHTVHFQSPVPWTLEAARWLAALSTGLVLVDGALRLLHVERAGWRLRRMEGHAVVCGLGRRGLAVIKRLREQGRPVVAIERDPGPEVTERLHRLGVPLVTGDATRAEKLREARLEHARALYALCPEDATNCEIAATAAHLGPCRTGGRDCFVHLSDTDLRSALQSGLAAHPDACQQRLQLVDAFDPPALDLLVHGLPLDHDGIAANDPRRAHLVILGFGRMGRTLGVRAAQLGQFANGSRLRISVIDRIRIGNPVWAAGTAGG